MAAGVVDELVIKVGLEVDDSDIDALKKELQNNKKNTIKLKPEIPFSGSIPNSQDPLTNIQSKIDKEKTQETLNKILTENKKASDKLEDLDERQKENNESIPSESGGFFTGSGGILALIAGILTGGYLLAKEVQQRYIEKLDREVNFANLSLVTGETADQMAKLNYQAKNVGLSLDQVVHNAQSFASDIFSGQNDQKAMLLGALGINPVELIKEAKTPEQFAKVQVDLFEKAKSGLTKGGFPEFLATQRASEISGVPQANSLGYENLFNKKNLQSADEISKLRGSVGSRDSIMGNFQDMNAALQRSTAAVDNLLSTGNVAKAISIGVADLRAQTVNLINATINQPNIKAAQSALRQSEGVGGLGAGQAIFDQFSHRPPSSSSQTKMGGN